MKKKENNKNEDTINEAVENSILNDEIVDLIVEDAPKNEDEFAKLKDVAAQSFDKYQRTLAEFDNYRKRSEREKAVIYDEGVKDTIDKILPVMDLFERALKTIKDPEDSFCKGIQMIANQMSQVFTNLGATEIPALGVEFDPNLHEAVMHVQDDSLQDNMIVEELQKGYMFKGKVIRHSMVKVSN